MNTSKLFFFIILIFPFSFLYGQTNLTANVHVPEYSAGFRLGTNLGGHQGKWDDIKLATIAAGSEIQGVPGAGCNNLRLSLPNAFLERWGYEIRKNTFSDYKEKLGMSQHTVFLGGPSDINIDKTIFCSAKGSSKMFKNMYEPIWDNGENGTPVNEKNVFALYVFKTATVYGETVRFWEIFNEPDYTSSDKGWQEPGSADNWWKRDPAPCELNNLLAPVQHYIRALRIAYEVIKYIDPDDFVCVGGIGYESFLDAVLRNSDNPDGGKITSAYPLKGGAYFDALSYHSYPMYETREYTDGKWVPMRHSDKAVEVFINAKTRKEEVLKEHGYDGGLYPKKRVIVTETNIPRRAFDNYIGSEKIQYNYLSKIIIKGQKEGIDQIHTFALTDSKTANGPYDVMGFYPNLSTVNPFEQKEYLSAVATRNVMQILEGYKYSDFRTDALSLPENIDGAAFVKDGTYIYALWAKTSIDNKEEATASYSFPSSWGVAGYERYAWNYTLTKDIKNGSGTTIQLDESPSFFILDNEYVLGVKEFEEDGVKIYPNPASNKIHITSNERAMSWKNGKVLDTKGRVVNSFSIEEGSFNFVLEIDLMPGLYFIKLDGEEGNLVKRMIVE